MCRNPIVAALSKSALAPSFVFNPGMGSSPKTTDLFPPLGACGGSLQPAAAPLVAGSSALAAPPNADSEIVRKRKRLLGISDEVNDQLVNTSTVKCESCSHAHQMSSYNDLPKKIMGHLNQGSSVKSMDFHPVQQTLLLVGTSCGSITMWELCGKKRLLDREFELWEPTAHPYELLGSFLKDYSALVNRVIWSPSGAFFGVAYSKHLVHIYSYHGDEIRRLQEIGAHTGNVSDLAFCHLRNQSCIITCGEDKTVKVWDVVTGKKQYIFEGHEAPVYSVYPAQKENIQFILSTAIDGKMKAWLYDNMRSRANYDVPGQSLTRMASSADGRRLFSCGTNKKGESYIVEWDDHEGTIKRAYRGLGKVSEGVVQFDTAMNRFLAAGDDFQVKFWDVDSVNLLTTFDAGGGLMATPCLRFNKEGTLLAVSTSESGIIILANADGIQLLCSTKNCAPGPSRAASGFATQGPVIRTLASCSTSGTSTGVADRNLPMTAMVGPSMSGVKPYCKKGLEHCQFQWEEFNTTTATSQNALSSEEDYELHVDVSGDASEDRKAKRPCQSIDP